MLLACFDSTPVGLYLCLPLGGCLLRPVGNVTIWRNDLAQSYAFWFALQSPRVEAQTILGSVLCFPNLYFDVPVLNPDSSDPQAIVCNNIKV